MDLATVDPLIMDDKGTFEPRASWPVSRCSRFFSEVTRHHTMTFAAAVCSRANALPHGLDLLLAPPSRQMLEVLGQTGALVDLIATVRTIELDHCVMTGELSTASRQCSDALH